jgi:hypothetical protein
MKRQALFSGFSAKGLQRLRRGYATLQRTIARQAWLVQGSVNEIPPKAPGGNATYTWTRKVRAKTVTVALSASQARIFREAIHANRRLEQALEQLRNTSQEVLLQDLPGVSKRRTSAARSTVSPSVEKSP